MTAPLDTAKTILREQIRARLHPLSAAERNAASVSLCARLRESPVWAAARSVLLFAPLPDEPDLWPLVNEAITTGKLVALPAFTLGTRSYLARQIIDPSRDIVAGKFDIREPGAGCAEIPLNRLDLVLVPGVAFDARGGRLGRGQGFYDRLLAGEGGTKCGVAFDEQIVNTVPVGPQDIRVNCILTPTRWIET